MKLSIGKIFFLSTSVLVTALGLMAFTPFTGLSQVDTEDDGDLPSDPMQALADALGVTIDDLQAAHEAAAQQAHEQSVNTALERGLITQEQADEMLSGEARSGRRGHFGRGFGGADLDALVAAELGISVEDYQAAQAEVFTDMIGQAVADGRMTQTAGDLALARQAVGSYFEEAWASAYQNAVQSALEDGAIDQAQSELLLDNMDRGGFGRMPLGGPRGGHFRPPNGPPADAPAE